MHNMTLFQRRRQVDHLHLYKVCSVFFITLLLSMSTCRCETHVLETINQTLYTSETIIVQSNISRQETVISTVMSADWFDIPSGAVDVKISDDGLFAEYFVETKPKLRYWPTRKISVQIGKNFSGDDAETIWTALNELSKILNGCITFLPKHGKQRDYLYFKKESLCDSGIGYTSGRHRVKLGTTCLDPEELGAVQHEVLHALGFYHEHSRNDRDDFVEVNWNNVQRREKRDFKKLKFHTFDLPYDYSSVMHYASDAYAINDTIPTLKPVKPINITTMGQRIGLSDVDVMRLRIPYKCEMSDGDYESSYKFDSYRQSGKQDVEGYEDFQDTRK